VSIIRDIRELEKDDTHLARLFDKVQEYAELYLIAKQRQKGCDGMGEVATLKDEFIYSLNEMIRYCKENGYFSGEISYEIDQIAGMFCNL
jgi:hypothetical protein